MYKLNEYLQQLLSNSGYELHLQPNKQPYITTPDGNIEISNSPLPGAQINTMIFSLIPPDVKQQLPDSSEVEFVFPHNLGDFSFFVKKSPSGFVVTVTPSKANFGKSNVEKQDIRRFDTSVPDENPSCIGEQQTSAGQIYNDSAEELVIEINSPPQEKNNFLTADDYTESLLVTNANKFQQNGNASSIRENSTETFSNRDATSSFYPEIEIERNIPVTESFAKEQVYDVEQLNSYPNNQFSNNSESPENMTDNFNSPNRASGNTEIVPNNAAPTVGGMPPQNANSFAPQFQPPPQVVQTPPPVVVKAVQANPQAKAKMDSLFHKMAGMGASDLHLSVSVSPMVRKDGRMAKLDESMPNITPDAMKQLLQSIMPPKNIEEFAERNDTDFAYEIKGLARFRANIFMDRKGMGGVFRIIPSEILTAEKLGLSKAIMDLCELSKGLVVVTGPTGSGKSTTLCAMVDSINKQREDHIITIEDPIEFTHENQKCLVNQREVHNHTDSFKDALRAALREDPDILLVGEMRDLETISIAIETAETGHLVFGTLHTTTAASTVDRIIDQFPADRQQQVRVMLSESLRGVIAQTLLPKIGGGRIAALEVLIVTPAISNLIREGKTFQIPSSMQTGKSKGMVMLNDALMELVMKGLVEPKDAYVKAVDKTGFEMLLQRNGKKI